MMITLVFMQDKGEQTDRQTGGLCKPTVIDILVPARGNPISKTYNRSRISTTHASCRFLCARRGVIYVVARIEHAEFRVGNVSTR